MSTALTLDGVGKRYRLPTADARRGFLSSFRKQDQEFWALRNVNFEVRAGEALGIIGHNGAGKSTLLKLLSGITAPTAGRMEIQGRMAGLLEVGSGFHPELTGRENIFLSGTILGMRRSEIHRKLENIIDFAEVRQFIDLPVKRYSSGMYVRLGFSIAAHLEPDILLLDEVLAVGDAAFQLKCIQRVQALHASGVTIVFISHDLKAVASLCPRSVLLHRGEIVYDGPTDQTVTAYQGMRGTAAGRREVRHRELEAEVRGVQSLDREGLGIDHGSTGELLRIAIEFSARAPLQNTIFEVFFRGSDRRIKAVVASRSEPIDVPAGEGRVEFVCDPLCLGPDVYEIDASICREGESEPLDRLAGCLTLPVQSATPVRGQFHQPFRFGKLSRRA